MSNTAILPALATVVLFVVVGLALVRLLYSDLSPGFEAVILGFALGSGLATLALFVSFLLMGQVSYLLTMLVLGAVVLLSLIRQPLRSPLSLNRPTSLFPTGWFQQTALVVCSVLTLLVLFRASYWPFFAWDSLSHWALRAQTTYQTGIILPRLPSKSPGQLHNQYPLWLPLAYDWVAFFNGEWPHVGPKLVNATVFPGLLGATYLLGREALDERTGAIAVIALSFTPLVTMFASIGYADIPLAFFTTLAAYYGLQAIRKSGRIQFLMAGLMAGLGGWTKIEGAVTGVLFMIVLTAFIIDKYRTQIRQLISVVVTTGIGFSIPIAPWYLYLLIVGRFGGGSSSFLSVPQLDPSHALRVLLVLAQTPVALRPYDPTGLLVLGAYVLIVLSIALIGWLVYRRRTPFLVGVALVNGFFVYFVFYQTYHDLWFLLTTSAPRYFFHFEGVVVVLIVVAAVELLQFVLHSSMPVLRDDTRRRIMSGFLVILLVVGAIPISSGVELGADRYAVTHLAADTEDKYRYRFGGTYETLQTTSQLADSGSRIYIIDNYRILAPYLLPNQVIRPPFSGREGSLRKTIQSPPSREAFVSALRNAEIEYVVIAGPEFVREKPAMQRQARFARESPELEVVWTKAASTGERYVIYRLLAA